MIYYVCFLLKKKVINISNFQIKNKLFLLSSRVKELENHFKINFLEVKLYLPPPPTPQNVNKKASADKITHLVSYQISGEEPFCVKETFCARESFCVVEILYISHFDRP